MQVIPRLYFDEYRRDYCTNLTEIYIAGIKERVIPNFKDYHDRADQVRDQYLQTLMEAASEATEGERIYESAFAYGFKEYCDGIFLNHQMIAISCVGLYHLWEKLIKSFIYDESDKDGIIYEKQVSNWNMDDIHSCLVLFGHDIKKNQSWYNLNRLRLVANVVKHGSGMSKRRLASVWPEIVPNKIDTNIILQFSDNELKLSEEHFDQLAHSVRLFWQEMPECLIYVARN